MAGIDEVIAHLDRLLAGVRPQIAETGGIRADSATKRFRGGWTTEAELRAELNTLGFQTRQIDRLVIAADLDYDTEWRSDLLDAYRTAFTKDLITQDEYVIRLTELEIVSERIDAYLLWDTAKKTPKPTAPPAPVTLPLYKTEAGKVEVRAAREAFKRGALTYDQLSAELSRLEMPPDLARAIANLEAIKLLPKP